MSGDAVFALIVIGCSVMPFGMILISEYFEYETAKCRTCKKRHKKKNMQAVEFYPFGTPSAYMCAKCHRKHSVNEMFIESSDSTDEFLKKYGGLIDGDKN